MKTNTTCKADRDINEEMGLNEVDLSKMSRQHWNVLQAKGDPRTMDMWDKKPIAYEDRKKRCNTPANSRAYSAFRCSKAEHEVNVVRDYLIKHELPVPQDFQHPTELQPATAMIQTSEQPQVIHNIPKTTNPIASMWMKEALSEGRVVYAPVAINNVNIVMVTTEEQMAQVIGKLQPN